jgi:hypothetical protein
MVYENRYKNLKLGRYILQTLISPHTPKKNLGYGNYKSFEYIQNCLKYILLIIF